MLHIRSGGRFTGSLGQAEGPANSRCSRRAALAHRGDPHDRERRSRLSGRALGLLLEHSELEAVVLLKRTLVLVISSVLFVVAAPQLATAQDRQSGAQDPPNLPGRAAGAPECKLDGALVHIPSRVAGPQGLLVRVAPPAKGRYSTGAPIIVHATPVPGTDTSRACLKEHGFIEIGFLCPGGQDRSGGRRFFRWRRPSGS